MNNLYDLELTNVVNRFGDAIAVIQRSVTVAADLRLEKTSLSNEPEPGVCFCGAVPDQMFQRTLCQMNVLVEKHDELDALLQSTWRGRNNLI